MGTLVVFCVHGDIHKVPCCARILIQGPTGEWLLLVGFVQKLPAPLLLCLLSLLAKPKSHSCWRRQNEVIPQLERVCMAQGRQLANMSSEGETHLHTNPVSVLSYQVSCDRVFIRKQELLGLLKEERMHHHGHKGARPANYCAVKSSLLSHKATGQQCDLLVVPSSKNRLLITVLWKAWEEQPSLNRLRHQLCPASANSCEISYAFRGSRNTG